MDNIAKNVKKVARKVVDKVVDKGIDKVSSAGSRAGSTVDRVGKLLNSKVSKKVVALQMTENSPKKQTYTENDVEAYKKLYDDCKTKVPLTAEQTTALMKDQNTNCNLSDSLTPVDA